MDSLDVLMCWWRLLIIVQYYGNIHKVLIIAIFIANYCNDLFTKCLLLQYSQSASQHWAHGFRCNPALQGSVITARICKNEYADVCNTHLHASLFEVTLFTVH
jgi:hypothetical protein